MRPNGCVKTALAFAAAFALFVATAGPSWAQDSGTITGQVTEAGSGRVISGAQVFIPGTVLGTLTGTNGRFLLLNVPAGQVTLRVQMIGHSTADQVVTVAGGQSATANFEMRQSVIALDEVVVTGAGVATERRKLGNTVSTINTAAIEDAPIANLSEMLAARTPGVVALPTGGMAGEGAKIKIRGSASLSQINRPVVYIDGIRVDATGGFAPNVGAGGGGTPSRLDDINPDAIERIEILKGAAAATLYGTEASAGVIQIFTKAGSNNAPRYDIQIEQSFSRYPEDAYEPNAGFARTQAQADALSQHWGRTITPFQVFEEALIPRLYETGHGTTASLSVSGGSDLLTYFLSGRLATEDGPFGGTSLGPAKDEDQKKQANANLTIYPIDKLRVRVNAMYTESFHATPENNNNIYGTISSVIMAKPEIANCNESSRDPSTPGRCTGAGNAWGAPAFITTRESMHSIVEDEVQRFAGSVGTSYELLGVHLDATFGIDFVNQRGLNFLPYGYNVDNYTSNAVLGYRGLGERNNREITGDAKATWNVVPNDVFSFQTTLGAQGFFSTSKTSGGDGEELPGPGVEVLGAASIQSAFEGFLSTAQLGLFGQEQIGYRDWAFLTLGARFDKHSAFGESSEGILYPKVSISVIPTTMLGYSSDLLSSFRVRAAIGQSGRQPGAFDKYTTYVALGSDAGAGLAPGNLGNLDLEPEVSTEYELGAEVGLFNDRLGLDVTYWDRTVDHALVNRQYAPSGGFRATQLSNIGQLDAHGWELGAKGAVYSSPAFSVNMFVSAAYMQETVTDLGGAPPLKAGGSYPRYRNYIREGHAPGAFFGPKLRQVGAGFYPIDSNADCQPDSEAELLSWLATPRSPDAIAVLVEGGDPRAACAGGDFLGYYLGKPTPDWTGSFGANISFLENFELATLFEFKAGNFQIHDLTGAFRRANPLIGRNIASAAEVEATLLNPASSAEARLEAARIWATEMKALSPLDGLNEIQDADFVRWREVNLTYNAPESLAQRIGARRLAFTLGGRNLMIWSKFSGADPEINAEGLNRAGSVDANFLEGTNAFGVPIPRRFTFATRIGF